MLNHEMSPYDFRSYYWLKDELVLFCRKHGISSTGSKPEITARIEAYLACGCISGPEQVKASGHRTRKAGRSKNMAAPDLTTAIGSDYTNSQANRAFFLSVIGPGFHFTTRFMRFCKEHPEKTYGDAVNEWLAEQAEKRSGLSPKPIAPQFEYNRFVRAYVVAHKGATLKDAVKSWNEYKQLRR